MRAARHGLRAFLGGTSMYTFAEIKFAWDEAGVSGDWFEFIKHLGTTESKAENEPKGVFEHMGIESPPFPAYGQK